MAQPRRVSAALLVYVRTLIGAIIPGETLASRRRSECN